jgi:CDP-diacylglycerol--serine O-phosphatidyltransferase
MGIVKQIPNYITLGNLLSGTIAVIFAVNGNYKIAALLVCIGVFLDFFDGFVARLLNVSGELGKQLDSLADMVTSGVVPGIVMYKLLQDNLIDKPNFTNSAMQILDVPLIGLILTLAAGFRLAKFNIDIRQTDSFIGLPTPAMSLFILSLPLILEYTEIEFVENLIKNNYFLIALTFVLSYLMNAELHLFSLKFKEYSFKKNIVKYIFLLSSLLLILTIHFLSIPIIIIFYVTLSIIKK